jgi:hypothetical protein
MTWRTLVHPFNFDIRLLKLLVYNGHDDCFSGWHTFSFLVIRIGCSLGLLWLERISITPGVCMYYTLPHKIWE